MLLSIQERLQVLNGLLPQEGDFVTLRVVNEANNTIGLSSDELEKWGVVQEDGMVRWNTTAESEVDIPITDAARGLIAKELNRLNDEDKLTIQQLSLWDKFVSPNGQTQ